MNNLKTQSEVDLEWFGEMWKKLLTKFLRLSMKEWILMMNYFRWKMYKITYHKQFIYYFVKFIILILIKLAKNIAVK